MARMRHFISTSRRLISDAVHWIRMQLSHIISFQNTLIFLLVLAIILAIIFVMVMVRDDVKAWTFELLGLSSKSEVLKFIGIGMGGVLIALQALMSYKRAKAMEDTVSNTERGLRQERMKNAIEHLGHGKDSVRLGGAYELCHLAKDTPELCQTVLDILCAHIRQTTGESAYQEPHQSKPSEEVQSLLTLLFVQEHEIFKGCRINLQGSWLHGADLREARLEKAVLTRAYLQGSDLRKAHLQGTDLWDVNLQGAKLQKANLQGAKLQKANLQGAKLQKANLQGAKLQKANLQGAKLQKANLQGAKLQKANLQGAKLQKANLQGAKLRRANLQGVDLWDVNLQGANLWEANLQEAKLWKANLQGANLLATNLQGANLRYENLQGANLWEANLQGVDLWKANLQGAHLWEANLQGTNLGRAQMQEATLWKANLKGVRCEDRRYFRSSFEDRIRESIGKETDTSGVIFEGGLSREKVDSIAEGLSDDRGKELREKLDPHIGKPPNSQLPENSGATTGTYSKEEAEKWIAEYNKAMSTVPTQNENA